MGAAASTADLPQPLKSTSPTLQPKPASTAKQRDATEQASTAADACTENSEQGNDWKHSSPQPPSAQHDSSADQSNDASLPCHQSKDPSPFPNILMPPVALHVPNGSTSQQPAGQPHFHQGVDMRSGEGVAGSPDGSTHFNAIEPCSVSLQPYLDQQQQQQQQQQHVHQSDTSLGMRLPPHPHAPGSLPPSPAVRGSATLQTEAKPPLSPSPTLQNRPEQQPCDGPCLPPMPPCMPTPPGRPLGASLLLPSPDDTPLQLHVRSPSQPSQPPQPANHLPAPGVTSAAASVDGRDEGGGGCRSRGQGPGSGGGAGGPQGGVAWVVPPGLPPPTRASPRYSRRSPHDRQASLRPASPALIPSPYPAPAGMATGPPTGPYPLPRTPSAPSCADAQVQTDGPIPSPTYQQLQQQQHEEQQSEQVAGQKLAGGQGRGVWDSASGPELQSWSPVLVDTGPCLPASWRKGESLGSGAFGTVFLGLNNDTGELLAVKEVVVAEGDKGQEAVQQLEQEVTLLSRLQHPNIVRYVGTRREAASLLIFLEYVPGGSIASLLSRFGPLSEPVIRLFTRQLLSGLAYLHAQRTMHRDVKGANLLVEKTGCIKLADFGMAKTIAEAVSFTKSFKGSAFWMAPEVIRQQGHGVAADIWSLGCTVLEMATGKPPWAQCATQVQAIFKIASSSELPAVPAALSPQASEFILLCLQRDPAARPSAEALLRHPFVVIQPGTAMSPALAQQLQQAQQLEQGPPSCPLPYPSPSAVPSPSPSSLGGGGWQPGPSTVLGGGKGWPAQAAAAKAGATLPAQAGLLGHTTVKHGATEEELEDALAALVLGSNLQTLAGYAADRAAARDVSGGGGAGLGVGQEEEGVKPDADEEDRESIDREIDEGIDYTTQPALFKVRGLLSLPPLKMPPGGSLPVVLLSQQLAGQRPGTASSMLSGTSRF